MSKPSAALYVLKAVLDGHPRDEQLTVASLARIVKAAADEQADAEWQDYMGDDL